MHYTGDMEKPKDDKHDVPCETQAPDESSLSDWINRAKRARQLVEAVDLKKVFEHDETEVAKVASVSSALYELGQGHDLGHVEGVDEVIPDIDENILRRSALVEALSTAGFADRIGRVRSVQAEQSVLRPLDLIPHHEGLPDFDLCIAPETAPQSGHFGLFITSNGLFSASIAEPPNKHHWHIARSRPYEHDEELIENIRLFDQSGFES